MFIAIFPLFDGHLMVVLAHFQTHPNPIGYKSHTIPIIYIYIYTVRSHDFVTISGLFNIYIYKS